MPHSILTTPRQRPAPVSGRVGQPRRVRRGDQPVVLCGHVDRDTPIRPRDGHQRRAPTAAGVGQVLAGQVHRVRQLAGWAGGDDSGWGRGRGGRGPDRELRVKETAGGGGGDCPRGAASTGGGVVD